MVSVCNFTQVCNFTFRINETRQIGIWVGCQCRRGPSSELHGPAALYITSTGSRERKLCDVMSLAGGRVEAKRRCVGRSSRQMRVRKGPEGGPVVTETPAAKRHNPGDRHNPAAIMAIRAWHTPQTKGKYRTKTAAARAYNVSLPLFIHHERQIRQAPDVLKMMKRG